MNEAATAGRKAALTVMVRYSVLSELLVNLHKQKKTEEGWYVVKGQKGENKGRPMEPNQSLRFR